MKIDKKENQRNTKKTLRYVMQIISQCDYQRGHRLLFYTGPNSRLISKCTSFAEKRKKYDVKYSVLGKKIG